MSVKLTNAYTLHDDWTIADAVRKEIATDNHEIINTTKMLGRLIETLHESHCLTDEQMLQVIGGSWEIVK